jgi:DnaJ family protein C protein 3
VKSVVSLTISRTAAKTAHPDVGGSEEKMAQLNEAYEVLSDPGEQTTV